MKERDNSIDWLKGLAIFLVVMGHELQWCTFHLDTSQLLPNGNTGLVQQWISSFHMPLFMFMSGYLMGCKNIETGLDLGRGILRKIQTLLLPGVAWMLVKHCIYGGWYIEWFLKVLFVILVVLSVIRYISCRYHLHWTLEVLLHGAFYVGMMYLAHSLKGTPVYEHLCLRSIAGYYPYVAAGCMFMAQGWNEGWKKTNLCYTIALLVFALSYGLYYWTLYDTNWAVYIFPYIIAFSAILSLYFVANKIVIAPPPVFVRLNSTLAYMGRKSLAIYVIHFYFIMGIPKVADLWTHLTEHAVTSMPAIAVQLVYGVGASAVIVTICLGIEYMISQSKVLNLLCFGKDIK